MGDCIVLANVLIRGSRYVLYLFITSYPFFGSALNLFILTNALMLLKNTSPVCIAGGPGRLLSEGSVAAAKALLRLIISVTRGTTVC